MSILQTQSLYHDFDGMQVLSDVNLEVEEGERHAIIGPNGAGKTTLFNLINGDLNPSGGKIVFKDHDITNYKPFKLARLGMGRSFQITKTFHNMTAFDNIRMGVLSRRGIRFNLFRRVDKMEEITRETEEILERIELTPERDYKASVLSYGKHRSLEFSMAMTTDPDLVMLDEPTAGMSRELTKHAIKLIRKLTENKTTVIIEHDMDVVFALADRVTVLAGGTILDVGTPEEIRSNQAVKDAYLGNTED
ncbi:MAG: ABC transporter ATP-binding protein [Deltaproteobacteria bacterium]|nr:ABC transporter ATP-binding protein [Deltaproteobacteria bacterium]